METPERLQQQMKSMQDLHNIVSTMKALSASNIHQYEQAVESLADYWHTVELGLQVVLQDDTRHTAAPVQSGRIAAVVFGSDHGMCGRFNEDITRYALEHMQSLVSDGKPKILCLGLRAAELLERTGQTADEVLTLPGGANQISAGIRQILLIIDKWREDPSLTHLYLYYNQPDTRAAYQSCRFDLLPLDLAKLNPQQTGKTDQSDKTGAHGKPAWPGTSLPTYSMERGKLLSALLNQYFFISLFRACAESQAAEHGSRLTAMQSAEKNLEERMEELTGRYRRARQEIITSELLDIIGSFEAVSGKR